MSGQRRTLGEAYEEEGAGYDELRADFEQFLERQMHSGGADDVFAHEDTRALLVEDMRLRYGRWPYWFLLPPDGLSARFGRCDAELQQTLYKRNRSSGALDISEARPNRYQLPRMPLFVDSDGRAYWAASGPLVAISTVGISGAVPFHDTVAFLGTAGAAPAATGKRKRRSAATPPLDSAHVVDNWIAYTRRHGGAYVLVMWCIAPADADLDVPLAAGAANSLVLSHCATGLLCTCAISADVQSGSALRKPGTRVKRTGVALLSALRFVGTPDAETRVRVAEWYKAAHVPQPSQ